MGENNEEKKEEKKDGKKDGKEGGKKGDEAGTDADYIKDGNEGKKNNEKKDDKKDDKKKEKKDEKKDEKKEEKKDATKDEKKGGKKETKKGGLDPYDVGKAKIDKKGYDVDWTHEWRPNGTSWYPKWTTGGGQGNDTRFDLDHLKKVLMKRKVLVGIIALLGLVIMCLCCRRCCGRSE